MAEDIFTKDEKIIIQRLRNLDYGGKFLSNVIDPEMHNTRIKVDKKQKRAFILIEKPSLRDKQYERHVLNQIFNWVNYLIDISFVLIDTLVESGFAKKKRAADITDEVIIFGPGAFNVPFETIEITDQVKVDALLKYADIQVEILNEIDTLL